MKKTTGFYPRPSVDANGKSAVAQAGGVLLTSTVRAAGLDAGLSNVLGSHRFVRTWSATGRERPPIDESRRKASSQVGRTFGPLTRCTFR